MITKIEVDGLKSLSEFEVCLNSGLNILVGPKLKCLYIFKMKTSGKVRNLSGVCFTSY